MNYRASSYIRVSTNKQKDANTQDNQETAIREFAAANDIEIVKSYSDLGASGSDRTRKNFQKMLDELDLVDGIIVYDDDRLARDWDLSIDLMRLLRYKNKKLFIARKNRIIDFNTQKEDELLSVISGWVAEQERQKIKQRQHQGIQKHIKKYGTWGRKKIAINWKWYDALKAKELSDNAISKVMNVDYRTLRTRIAERTGTTDTPEIEPTPEPTPEPETRPIMGGSIIANSLIAQMTAKRKGDGKR